MPYLDEIYFLMMSKRLEQKRGELKGNFNGKIIRKIRNNDDNYEFSNIIHSLFGIKKYPDYLLRWELNDINELENQMLNQLLLIRKQKDMLVKGLNISKLFNGILKVKPNNITTILHKDILKFISFDDITNTIQLNINKIKNNPQFITSYNNNTVYSFPLFNDLFCDKILKHANEYLTYINKQNSNNKLNKSAYYERCVLDWMNLKWLNDFLLQCIINPMSNYLFRNELIYNCTKIKNIPKTINMDFRHGYLVGYQSKTTYNSTQFPTNKCNLYKRFGLKKHTDDSDITLNICISNECKGGELYVNNLRNKSSSNNGENIKLIKGHGIIHPGRMFHAVNDISNGNRVVLIIWSRDTQFQRKHVCPCCWVNRRDDQICISGQRWN